MEQGCSYRDKYRDRIVLNHTEYYISIHIDTFEYLEYLEYLTIPYLTIPLHGRMIDQLALVLVVVTPSSAETKRLLRIRLNFIRVTTYCVLLLLC